MQALIQHINRKYWWHVTPVDPQAYAKRGKFFASTYSEAQFYGRPNDAPARVKINAPVVGDNDSVERILLGKVESFDGIGIKRRFSIDARMRRAALRKGYDSIVVFSPGGYRKFREEGKIPRSIELNVVNLRCLEAC